MTSTFSKRAFVTITVCLLSLAVFLGSKPSWAQTQAESSTNTAAQKAAQKTATAADAGDIARAVDKATSKVSSRPYVLEYKFRAGQIVRTAVVHQVSMLTEINGVSQKAQSKSESVKRWQIKSVDASGNITFVHSVERAKMWQKVSGRDEIVFDSESSEKPHPNYAQTAETIGVPLATITVARNGLIKKREDVKPQFNPGIGDLIVPMAGKPVKIGQQWFAPANIRIRRKDGRVLKVETRQLYTLEGVTGNIADISVKTQVLTPIRDPKIKSELIQRLQNGSIKFDIEAGHVVSKQMRMHETVIGFNGAASRLEYLGSLTEKWVAEKSTETASRPKGTSPSQKDLPTKR